MASHNGNGFGHGDAAADDARRHENWLRARAREAVANGAMPASQANRMWGGTGHGVPCAVCGKSLAREAVELEVEFVDGGGGVFSRHLHVPCFAAWEAERHLIVAPAPGSTGVPVRGGLPVAPASGTIHARERHSSVGGTTK